MQNWTCGKPCTNGPQLTEIVQLSKYWDGSFAFVGYNAELNEIVVSFRGSANIVNWATNIEIIERPYPGVEYAGV